MDTKAICEKVRAQDPPRLVRTSADTGIPYSTLMAIKRGRTKNPRGMTVDKLRAYFNGSDNGK